MNELQKLAFELLESDQVQLVIAYKKANELAVRAAFIRKSSEVEKMVFDSSCVMNLAVYLNKKEFKAITGIAIVAGIPVMRSILQLARENQLNEKSIKVIGIAPSGSAQVFSTFSDMQLFLEKTIMEQDSKYKSAIQKIRSLPMEERWNYWMAELSDCFKCYACRAACPMCYCTKCIVDSNQPQWIPASSRPLANLEWHINRAMHMAGRCSQCDACAEACPLGIPINLITRNMISDYEEAFGPVKSGVATPNLLSSFSPSDKENFIR